MTIPEGTGQVVANKTMTLDTMETVEIPWTGEGIKSVDNGAGYETIYGNMIAQAMRAHVNAIETMLVTKGRAGASRAYGTPTTTPFGTAGDNTDASNTLKILKDNGAGNYDNQLVINTTSGANFLGKQSQVMCVTHLPQVAAQAHNQLFVTKLTDGESTENQVLALTKQDRIEELARLLAGDKVSKSALANAKELLKSAASN
mgnify:CR=1 FL=1